MIESHPRPESVDRVASVPLVAVLAVADALVVTAFVAVGLHSHGMAPWEFPAHTVRTATPFVIGWATVAALVGAYRGRVLESARRTVAVVGLAWIGASLLGGAIRATSLFPGGAPPSFLLVNAVLGLGFVLPWRLAVTGTIRGWRGRR
ncbi:DUF3054 domain-containing protein [Halosolutus amylolyticus]|uniref:DUF3054 domain-containing protein n=1 Tax=Halosolutus amylolyticus TaxID=2932267 RepID=A0ABD5PWD7_9EURY|nr:DUF3054 domain-containing protein [Halosolutus amylolyticus]